MVQTQSQSISMYKSVIYDNFIDDGDENEGESSEKSAVVHASNLWVNSVNGCKLGTPLFPPAVVRNKSILGIDEKECLVKSSRNVSLTSIEVAASKNALPNRPVASCGLKHSINSSNSSKLLDDNWEPVSRFASRGVVIKKDYESKPKAKRGSCWLDALPKPRNEFNSIHKPTKIMRKAVFCKNESSDSSKRPGHLSDMGVDGEKLYQVDDETESEAVLKTNLVANTENDAKKSPTRKTICKESLATTEDDSNGHKFLNSIFTLYEEEDSKPVGDTNENLSVTEVLGPTTVSLKPDLKEETFSNCVQQSIDDHQESQDTSKNGFETSNVWHSEGIHDGVSAWNDSNSKNHSLLPGMTMHECREMQRAQVTTVSGDSLRDQNWHTNVQAGVNYKKNHKLHLSTDVWSSKDNSVIQTTEPGFAQKRKHQINWLAAEAHDKEFEMLEMTARNRQNKYQTAMKYGW